MDAFALEILERTLELAIEAIPPEQDPAVNVAVNVIRLSIESSDLQNRAALHRGIMELAKLARENREFLIAARLEAFALEMNIEGRSHDVA